MYPLRKVAPNLGPSWGLQDRVARPPRPTSLGLPLGLLCHGHGRWACRHVDEDVCLHARCYRHVGTQPRPTLGRGLSPPSSTYLSTWGTPRQGMLTSLPRSHLLDLGL